MNSNSNWHTVSAAHARTRGFHTKTRLAAQTTTVLPPVDKSKANTEKWSKSSNRSNSILGLLFCNDTKVVSRDVYKKKNVFQNAVCVYRQVHVLESCTAIKEKDKKFKNEIFVLFFRGENGPQESCTKCEIKPWRENFILENTRCRLQQQHQPISACLHWCRKFKREEDLWK